jgi:DNA-binding NarL/FixJ family response regulator
MQWLAELARSAGLPGAEDLAIARGTLPADAWRMVGLLDDVGGIQVIGVATDGHEGLDAILTLSPDVVILDIRMPGMSGIELMEDLRHREVSPIILVLTNFPYPAYRKRCQELGAEYFFDKSTEFRAAAKVLQGLASNGARLSRKARHGR